MDEDLKQLEAELQALQPAAPRRDLVTRIEAELAAPTAAGASPSAAPALAVPPVSRPSRQWWLYTGAAMAAAAAVALTLIVLPRRAGPPDTPASEPTRQVAAVTPVSTLVAEQPIEDNGQTELAVFKPVASENVLYAVRDEGLVTLDDGTAARRERLNYVDTITWKNPRTNASVKWTVPREEIRVVPVKFQ